MSAAVPWIGVLIAIRSAFERTFPLLELISRSTRRRPDNSGFGNRRIDAAVRSKFLVQARGDTEYAADLPDLAAGSAVTTGDIFTDYKH